MSSPPTLEIGSKARPIKLSLTEYDGKRSLDIRRYFRDKDSGQLLPTTKGIGLDWHSFREVHTFLLTNGCEIRDWLAEGEPKLFCHSWMQFSDYPAVKLPDGRVEIAVGDLVSEEDRHLVLLTEVLPLPLLPDGTLPASLEGEELLGIEFVWTEIGDTEIKGCTSAHLVRIRGTQNAADVVLNEEIIAVITNQIAAKATREAANEVRMGEFDKAARSLAIGCAIVKGYAAGDLTSEANDLLDQSLRTVNSPNPSSRDLKDLVYESRYYARTSSHTLYTGSRKKSKLGRKPSAQDQCQEPEQ